MPWALQLPALLHHLCMLMKQCAAGCVTPQVKALEVAMAAKAAEEARAQERAMRQQRHKEQQAAGGAAASATAGAAAGAAAAAKHQGEQATCDDVHQAQGIDVLVSMALLWFTCCYTILRRACPLCVPLVTPRCFFSPRPHIIHSSRSARVWHACWCCCTIQSDGQGTDGSRTVRLRGCGACAGTQASR